MVIYRYLPLPLYWLLLAAWGLFPFLRKSLGPRLGFSRWEPGTTPVVWLHASSVGEISSIGPVVAEIRKRRPGARLVVTTMTTTGQKRARETLEETEILVAPLDFLPAVRRFVARLNPALLIVGETEMWPNVIVETTSAGCALVLVNGRISNKSFPRYRAIRPLMTSLLSRFDLLLMKTSTDAERIADLGGDEDRVRVTGNTKFDILPRPLAPEARRRVRQELGIDPDRFVISLGSARTGESEVVLEALAGARLQPPPVLIVAPRHLSLVPEIEEVCRSRGCTYATVGETAAAGAHVDASTEVIILGQMGRLLEVYAISEIAIVGGTFKPLGGHNPLEPVSQGTATVVGPHIHNIAEDIKYLRSCGCACVVAEDQLGEVLKGLATDRPKRGRMASGAVDAVRDRKGIAGKCVDMIEEKGLLP
jgi:3-deoxy-D-manno-octulosonic-acid transferase